MLWNRDVDVIPMIDCRHKVILPIRPDYYSMVGYGGARDITASRIDQIMADRYYCMDHGPVFFEVMEEVVVERLPGWGHDYGPDGKSFSSFLHARRVSRRMEKGGYKSPIGTGTEIGQQAKTRLRVL